MAEPVVEGVPDRAGEDHRHARLRLRRPVLARRGIRVERAGTGEPRARGGQPARDRPRVGIVDDDTLRRSFERFQALGVDQVVLDLQTVEGDILAVLDRYGAVLTAI